MSLTLLDWRRQIAGLYGEVRASSDMEAAHRLWRDGRDELFRNHPDSPLRPEEREHFTALPMAPYDAAFRFEVEVDTDVAPAHLAVPTGTDGVVTFKRLGRLHLTSLPGPGETANAPHPEGLDVWWLTSYGGGVFVPVKDALAGTVTYGGGRYLVDTVKGADLGGDARDGTLVVDLNFAYNPSCAYDPAWACPLAPPGNVLHAPVMAGELTGHHPHDLAEGGG